MPQLQAQVPHPLRHHLPALLPPGGVAAPTIRVEFLILIGKRRFKGATMQVHFDDIGGREPLLPQSGKEEFVHDTRPRDANGTLLLTLRMSRDDHTAREALRANQHCWAVIEASHALAFR